MSSEIFEVFSFVGPLLIRTIGKEMSVLATILMSRKPYHLSAKEGKKSCMILLLSDIITIIFSPYSNGWTRHIVWRIFSFEGKSRAL
jgi:hypothetical protein